MLGQIYALLVGIDTYQGGVPSLHGCRNDITRITEVLERRVEASGQQLQVTTLLDAEATRDVVIETFRRTFADASAGDVALFYYSGHGSQEEAPPEHLAFEPDGLNETLVLADSRTETGFDLADKELAVLVAGVARRDAHVLVVLDCCHSGSGVRDATETTVRRAPTSRKRRDAASYLEGAIPETADADATRRHLGRGRYVLLAACRSDQTAKEIQADGKARGAMSLALESALTAITGPMTYLQLHRAVAAAVRRLVSDQTPVLECLPPSETDRLFLGGLASSAVPLVSVTHGGQGWQMDVGALHGIPSATDSGRPTTVTVHGLTAEDLGEEQALARAHTSSVRATSSDLVIDGDPAALDPDRTYRAVIRDLPSADVLVSVDDSVPGADRLAAALAMAQGLAVVGSDGRADLRLTAVGGQLCLVRPGTARSLVASRPLSGPLPDSDIEAVRDEVVHVGRWLSLGRRHNPTSRLDADAVSLEVLDTADRPLPVDDDGRVRVIWPADADEPPRIRVRFGNRSQRRLFATVLALSELYGVEPLLEGEGEWLDPGSHPTFVPNEEGTPDLYLSVPEGDQMTTDVLKLIASTREFAARTLRQPDMTPPSVRTPTRGPTRGEKGIHARRPGQVPEQAEDWTTREILLTTYRPQAFVAIPGTGSSVLEGGTRLAAHPAVRGRVRLTPRSQATREALVPLVPSVLLDDPDTEPFSFLPVRSLGGEIDVLELEDVQNPQAVTVADPLVLRVPQQLGPGEVILPVMFDGEDYLPLGAGTSEAGETEIRLTRLPSQGLVTTRSLGGSLKILFRKLVGRRIGLGYDWPHLSLVRYDRDGTPHYEHDPAAVRQAVSTARRVLLLVHGIIGDTIGMARAAGLDQWRLSEGFDAVLALDYENIHTSVERTAYDLAEALREAGIDVAGGRPGPRLTIVAHSMGGLVSRCFIERQGGATVAERLITCGTPHAGSPWPRVQDGVNALLGLGLNGLLPIGGPLAAAGTVLAFLSRAAERVDTTLDEMRAGSDLLTTLAGAVNPGVSYVTVRGTQPLPRWADEGRAGRIVGKLTGSALDLVFRGSANDIAVTVDSAGAVGSSWLPRRPAAIDAACSHVAYFSADEGLTAVRAALQFPGG
jgi:hypothetical protein